MVFVTLGSGRGQSQTGGAGATPDANQPKQEAPLLLHVDGSIDNVVQFEDLTMQNGDWLLNANRMTFGVTGKTRKWFDFSARVVSKLYGGTTELYLAPYMVAAVRQALLIPDPLTGLLGVGPYLRNQVANTFYVQEAYGGVHLGPVYVRLGRQRFSSGTGYSFNPTDLFNHKNPIDPLYEVDGMDAISVEMKHSGKEVRFLLRPSASRSPDYLLRAGTVLANWKVAAQFTSIERARVVWGAINTTAGLSLLDQGSSVSNFTESSRWRQIAVEFERAWGGLRFYGEAGFAFVDIARKAPAGLGTLQNDDRDHERILIGLDRKFPSGLRMVLEYMRLGQGRLHDQPLTLNDLMAYYTGEVLTADKDTVYGEISRPLTKRVDAELKTTTTVNHPGILVNPWVHFRLAPGLKFSLSVYDSCTVSDGLYSNGGLGAYARVRFDF